MTCLNKKLQRDQPKAFGLLNVEELQFMNLLNNALILPFVPGLPNFTRHLAVDITHAVSRLDASFYKNSMTTRRDPLDSCLIVESRLAKIHY